MTDPTTEQIIEVFAEFMGWSDGKNDMRDPVGKLISYGKDTPDGIIYTDRANWNPTKDENHFRTLLEKIMSDRGMAFRYYEKLLVTLKSGGGVSFFIGHCKATLEERCKALYFVLPSTTSE